MVLVRKIGTAISLVDFWRKAKPEVNGWSPKTLVDCVFAHRGVAPIQVPAELLALADIVQHLRPKALLEIGTCNGGTFFVLCRLADPKATVVSLDLPGGKFGGGYELFRVPVLRRMKSSDQTLHLLRENSHSAGTTKKVASILNGNQLDFLFIDGDHTYEGVRMDFEMYSPFVRPGGVIAFHDIVAGHPDLVGEVRRFWNDVKSQYSHREIIEDQNQPWGGIGVLFV